MTAHEQWMTAYAEVDTVVDEDLRETLRRRLNSVAGELKIGAQADPATHRAALGTIRDVRRLAREAT